MFSLEELLRASLWLLQERKQKLQEELERAQFDQRMRLQQDVQRDVRNIERERCAQIAERSFNKSEEAVLAHRIAAAIRASADQENGR
jgi:hypothetical protein